MGFTGGVYSNFSASLYFVTLYFEMGEFNMLKLYVAGLNRLAAMQSRVAELKEDRSGATIIEYSLLIGLLTVAVIALVLFIGQWLVGAWTVLKTNVGAVPA
jgi:pilus assembly protein Flp/PilA